MSRVLKEQFIIEVKDNSGMDSVPFDRYPAQTEIDAFMSKLPSGVWHVRVAKYYIAVEEPSEGAESVKAMISRRREEIENMPDGVVLAYTEDEATEADKLRKAIFGADSHKVKLHQIIEAKLAECERVMQKPKRILMSTSQGRALIGAPGIMTQPPVRYRGIPITYIQEDMDEPLICW